METSEVISLARQFFYAGLLLIAPTVGVSLAIGLLVSIFQTITSIQEQTLTFAPRIIAVGIVICATLPWSLSILIEFTRSLLAELWKVTG